MTFMSRTLRRYTALEPASSTGEATPGVSVLKQGERLVACAHLDCAKGYPAGTPHLWTGIWLLSRISPPERFCATAAVLCSACHSAYAQGGGLDQVISQDFILSADVALEPPDLN